MSNWKPEDWFIFFIGMGFAGILIGLGVAVAITAGMGNF